MTATDVVPVTGRAIEEDTPAPTTREPLTWMTFLDYSDWVTGRTGNVVIAIGLNVPDIYRRISATPLTQIGNYSVGQLLLILLMVVGGAVPDHPDRRVRHGPVAGAIDHGRGPRARHRHRTRAARRFHASHLGEQRAISSATWPTRSTR